MTDATAVFEEHAREYDALRRLLPDGPWDVDCPWREDRFALLVGRRPS